MTWKRSIGTALLAVGLVGALPGCRMQPEDPDPANADGANLTMGTSEDGPTREPPPHPAVDGQDKPSNLPDPVEAQASPQATDTTAPGPPPPGGQYNKSDFNPEQMQQSVRNFADQYRQTIATACDIVIRESDDPDLRRRAQQTKIHGATAMYDIAVDPVPASAMLNAAVLVSLQRNYIARHGEAFFGKFAPRLIETANFLQEEIYALCARAMTNEQRRELLALCNQWSDANPDVYDFWYVRLTDLPGINKTMKVEDIMGTFTSLPGQFFNIFNPFAKGQESVSEAQALAERMSWLGPRLMILAQWRAEAVVYDSLANPQIETALEVGRRVAVVAEQLPETINQQREAIFRELEDHQGNISQLMSDAQSLAAEATQLLDTADTLVGRVQQMQADSRAAAEGQPPAEPGRPFDITEYTHALQELNQVVVDANTLLKNADDATAPDALDARLAPVESTVIKWILTAAAATLTVGLLLILAIKFIPSRRRG
jgi:hypothetical protein